MNGIIDEQQNCRICNQICKNRRSLGNHLAKSHREISGAKNYYIKYHLNDVLPLCACGCGLNVEWHNLKYQFNTFLTGHNRSGFREKQPSFTKEQIENRNEKIKQAYTDRGDEIKKKISDSVKIGLKDNVSLALANKKKWEDDEFRKKQHISRVKSWEGEKGQIRREKVFTPEFAKKISIANMNRDSNRVSKAESRFAEHLRSIGLSVETSKWFNFDSKSWCADIWLPDHNMIVEFDGTFWHGFDRTSDFTKSQIVNMTNDINKNYLAREFGLSILRIHEEVDMEKISSYDDLLNEAYHVVLNGEVKKEGTRKFNDDDVIISRNTIIKTNLEDKNITKNELMPAMIDFLKAHVQYHGWFYPQSDKDLHSELKMLKSSADKMNKSAYGSSWLKSRLRSFWDVDGGASKQFFNDKALTSVCSYRFGLNNSKLYEYDVDGNNILCNETFDITFKTIRTGFLVQRNKVSWFKPSWAVYIYSNFIDKKNKSPIVWDPSIGFSARLFAFSSVFDRGTYIGTDPAIKTFNDAVNISKEICTIKSDLKFDLRNSGSEFELYDIENESVDLVFTSPPYFDTEKYFNEQGQCWLDHNTYDEWIDKYLKKTFINAFNCLKKGSKMIINISEKYENDIIKTAIDVGFAYQQDLNVHIEITKDHFSRSHNKTNIKKENFLVFQK